MVFPIRLSTEGESEMCSPSFSACLACTKASLLTSEEISQKRELRLQAQCLKLHVCVCSCESPISAPVSLSLCVSTVATPKPSRSPVRHHNGPRKSIWCFEMPKKSHLPTPPIHHIIRFSDFILLQRHDRVRNHKESISQEGDHGFAQRPKGPMALGGVG